MPEKRLTYRRDNAMVDIFEDSPGWVRIPTDSLIKILVHSGWEEARPVE